ncbi:tyrosine-type recombinase/integrase [Gulosibacter molinativorax]|uniref:tyrosine-type recombinase/integrase n=1 Tax=Gulosibacter molinativorax TaxID=256821 RepID=UPI00068727C9|nr:tyrosine-type recombinase/integrase [Gulosibacter molinativorax]
MLTTAAVRDATNWDSSVAGLGPNLTRHRLRRTGATWVADAGVPLHVLQEILGHASMETTRGYLHPDDRYLASAAEQANVFLSPSGQKRQNTRSTSPTRRLREVETMLGAVLVPLCSPPRNSNLAPCLVLHDGTQSQTTCRTLCASEILAKADKSLADLHMLFTAPNDARSQA